MANPNNSTKVIVKNVRFSYVHVAEPVSDDAGREKYSVCVLIPKDSPDIPAIKAAIQAAAEAGKAKLANAKGVLPSNYKQPLRDGDTERDLDTNPECEGMLFINASTTRRPGIVGKHCEALDPSEIYSGCYGHVSLNFFAYNTATNKGVGAGLNNIMKTEDGEPLAGGSSAASDFGELAEKAADML